MLNLSLLTCKEEVNAQFCWGAENIYPAELHNFFPIVQHV